MYKRHQDIFMKHYCNIIQILEKQELQKAFYPVEISAACLEATLFSSFTAKQDFATIRDELYKMICDKILNNQSAAINLFNLRVQFYHSVLVDKKELHAVTLFGNIPEEYQEDMAVRFSIAAIDCLINPEWISDYENGAYPIIDIFVLSNLNKTAVMPIATELLKIYAEIIELARQASSATKFCSKCGSGVDENGICTKCGKKYFSFKRLFN